ncbi:MAG: DUF2017 domain-containing protein [Propionibacteriaceae bacterium]|nr:DUF2017 domain-containing protein [Propionibacteriaceae bacterium]
MLAFHRHRDRLTTTLQPQEAAILRDLASQFIDLVHPLEHARATPWHGSPGDWSPDDRSDVDDVADPALARLFPDAYPDDPDASGEFRRYTQSDQAAAKVEAARVMIEDLAASDTGHLDVPLDHVQAWLITVTNIRLVLAVRLGVTQPGDQGLEHLTADDPRQVTAEVYDWCAWIVETMVECL